MFANPIWYFVCIGVAVVFALLLNAYGNRAIDKARKDGMTDADIAGLQFRTNDDWWHNSADLRSSSRNLFDD